MKNSSLRPALLVSPLLVILAAARPPGPLQAIPLTFVAHGSGCPVLGRDVVLDLRRSGMRLSGSPYIPQFYEQRPEWSEDVTQNRLRDRMEDIFRNRARRVLFLRADPELPFGEVVKVIGVVRPAVDYIVLLLPADKVDSCFAEDPPFPPAQEGTLLREE
jgi:hypothetical protein